MVGVPVIINHKDITEKNADDERVGVVNSVWYDEKDGWFWCDGIIWDETAQNLITDKNWSVSCSYDVKTANDEGGSENNIKYDMEFLDGVFTHLALVDNPRYERANIVFNGKTYSTEQLSDEENKEKVEQEYDFNSSVIDNSKEQDMALLEKIKELISTVENEKGDDMEDKEKKEIDNEKVDKRKLIDEVGGILKGKVDDEIIRTIIGKLEKVAYDDSEKSADNEKEEDKKAEEAENKCKNESEEDKEKVKEVKEEVKEDVENKCKNSVDNAKESYFDKMNKIYNSAVKPAKSETEYVSRADRLKAAEDYFRV